MGSRYHAQHGQVDCAGLSSILNRPDDRVLELWNDIGRLKSIVRGDIT